MTLINSSPDKFRPAIEDFLESMTSVFKTPYNLKGDRIAIALQNYGEVLATYSDKVLAELWQQARVKFKGQWPAIKELTDLAGEVSGEIFKPTEKKFLTEREIMQSENGQRCLREGFANSFVIECERKQRILGDAETTGLLMEENAAVVDMATENFGSFTEIMRRAHDGMEAREARLQQEYGL